MGDLSYNKSTDNLISRPNLNVHIVVESKFILRQLTSNKFTESNLKYSIDEDSKSNESLAKRIILGVLRFLGLLTCLYFFVVSLNLMSTSFPLIAGKKKTFHSQF